MQKTILHIILLTFLLIGCECIPSIDTPKDIKPENGAKISFYHLAQDYNNITVENKDITLIDKLGFSEFSGRYKDAFPGYTNIKVKDISSGESIYNGIYSLEQGMHYSLYFYMDDRVQMQQVKDSVYKDAAFVRVVNMYCKSQFFDVSIANIAEHLQLKCGDLTELYEISKDENITILDENNNQIFKDNVKPVPNTITNLIIRFGESDSYSIVSYHIPF